MWTLRVIASQRVEDLPEPGPIIERALFTRKIFEKIFQPLKRICDSTEVETEN